MKPIFKNIFIFYNSYYYPVLIGALVLIGHTFSCELYTTVFLLLTVFLGLIICNDLKFIISPLIMFIYAFSQKNVESNTYYSKAYIVAIITFSAILFIFLILHFAIYKNRLDLKSIKNSSISLGISILCLSFLTNGIFSKVEYTSTNIFFALISIISLGLIYFVFKINLNYDTDLKKYLFFVLYITSVVLTLEVYLSFINQIEIVNGKIIKETILFGWGMWNNMGGLLAFLLPVHIYFASTVKKYGYLFFVSALISYLAVVVSLSRSSLLVSTFILVLCVICSCLFGQNKKTNRIIATILSSITLIGIIALWGKISVVLGDYLNRGFDSNGRFDIYKHGLYRFLKSPVFGGGFNSDYELDYVFIKFLPFRYHNTIIQILATCGVFGIGAYIYHRYTTIRLFLKEKTLFSLFSALCIFSLLLCSMLDNHFFNIYPMFIYSLIIVINEKASLNN